MVVRNNYLNSSDIEEMRFVVEGMNCVTPRAHDIVFRKIRDRKVEKFQLVIACLFEDIAPMFQLLRGGTSDVVLNKFL